LPDNPLEHGSQPAAGCSASAVSGHVERAIQASHHPLGTVCQYAFATLKLPLVRKSHKDQLTTNSTPVDYKMAAAISLSANSYKLLFSDTTSDIPESVEVDGKRQSRRFWAKRMAT
jgi:hypothetical protein